ncbi:MAG: HAD-IA family hydrolase [Candidatus Bathyarchaeia archaeon]
MERDVNLIIFDLDGTLVHLPIKYERLKYEMSRILKVDKIDSILSALTDVDEGLKIEIFNVWNKLELEALPNLKEKTEGIKIYSKFHGKTKCLVTLQGKMVVEKILEKTGLSFDYIVTREDSLNRIEQLRIIIEKFKVNPREVLVVGDRESDREAAEKIGCKFLPIREQ